MYRNGIKRLLAIVLSLCGMVCLSWLFLILAVAIKLDSPGPVFFKQKRVGIDKKHFYILKFRTMRIDTPHDMPTHLLHDPDQYITRMGHFLRKTSLDELPQLWNIFVGDMAVIGPRPALWNQYDLLAERIFQNCFFTERVVNGNCILPCELEIGISLDLSPEKRIIKQYTRR